MCKRDDIKCKICSSKLCVSWCCGYAMAHFSRSIFRHFFFFFFGCSFVSFDYLLISQATIFLCVSQWKETNADSGNQRKVHCQRLANAVAFVSFLRVRSRARARTTKWIVGTVWGKMSRYLNYGKSFIIAIITNANFPHNFCCCWLAVAFPHCFRLFTFSSAIFHDTPDVDLFT